MVTPPRPPQTVAVVAAVLLNRGRILLMLRSGSVASERHKWQCLTGYVDGDRDPLSQVMLELNEEAGLVPSDVDLLARANPVSVAEGRRSWTIYPFLFLAPEAPLRLNWEHDQYRWIGVGQLTMVSCVWWFPHVLRSLWPTYRRAST